MANLVKYMDQPLLEGVNTFTLRHGTEPSYGVFFCAEAEWGAISGTVSTGGDGGDDAGSTTIVGNLQFGEDDDDDMLLLQKMYLVKGEKDSRKGIYKLTIADRRFEQHRSQVSQDFNTYLSQDLNSAGTEYELTNYKTGTTEWAYSDLPTFLEYPTPVPTLTNTRHLRNVRGIGRTTAQVMQQLLYDSCSFMVYDPIADHYQIFKLGAYAGELEKWDDYIHRDVEIFPSGNLSPTMVNAYYSSAIDGGYQSKSSSVTGGTMGTIGLITAYTDSTQGEADAQSFADEMAGIYESANDDWMDLLLEGIQPVAPDNGAHIITWISGPQGAFTRIQRIFPLEIPPQIASSLFAHNGFTSVSDDMGEFQGDIKQMNTNNSVGWGPARFLPTRS